MSPLIRKNEVSEYPPGHEDLQYAVNLDAYEYLSGTAAAYLTAIEKAVNKGATPEEIRNFISRMVGPDRQSLARRCEQAAYYLRSLQARDEFPEDTMADQPRRTNIMASR